MARSDACNVNLARPLSAASVFSSNRRAPYKPNFVRVVPAPLCCGSNVETNGLYACTGVIGRRGRGRQRQPQDTYDHRRSLAARSGSGTGSDDE